MIHSDGGRNAIQGRISVYRLNEGIVEFSMAGSIILWGSLMPTGTSLKFLTQTSKFANCKLAY